MPGFARHHEHQHPPQAVTVNNIASVCTPTAVVRPHRKCRSHTHFECPATRWLHGGDIRVRFSWDTGNRKKDVDAGDRVLMLCTGDEFRGIVRDGHTLGPIFQDPHWHPRADGRPGNFVDIEWGTAVPLEDALPTSLLKTRIPEVKWDRLQSSGVLLRDPLVIGRLERLWSDHADRYRRQVLDTV